MCVRCSKSLCNKKTIWQLIVNFVKWFSLMHIARAKFKTRHYATILHDTELRISQKMIWKYVTWSNFIRLGMFRIINNESSNQRFDSLLKIDSTLCIQMFEWIKHIWHMVLVANRRELSLHMRRTMKKTHLTLVLSTDSPSIKQFAGFENEKLKQMIWFLLLANHWRTLIMPILNRILTNKFKQHDLTYEVLAVQNSDSSFLNAILRVF